MIASREGDFFDWKKARKRRQKEIGLRRHERLLRDVTAAGDMRHSGQRGSEVNMNESSGGDMLYQWLWRWEKASCRAVT